MTVQQWQKKIHELAVRKGWWENPDRPVREQITNMHAELSEAWEAYRNPRRDINETWLSRDDVDNHEKKPEGFGVELADCVIRIMDTCERYSIDLGRMIKLKTAYNEKRYGGKKV